MGASVCSTRRVRTMRSGCVFLIVAALTLVCVTGEEEKDPITMTREELITELTKSKSTARAELDEAQDKIDILQKQLTAATGDDYSEKDRRVSEKSEKMKLKQKEEAKKAAKLKKTEKLSDVLMAHGAQFLAIQAAKSTADKGSIKQKKAIIAAASKGARAGAVGPLKKVVRAAAVAAIKKARAAAQKAGTHNKHKIRKLSVKAARVAVEQILAEQDELIEKSMEKWVKEATAKHPPSAMLAEDDGKPNVFTAPPGVHLSMGSQVQALDDAASESKKKKEDEEDASAAKLAAGLIVPEHD